MKKTLYYILTAPAELLLVLLILPPAFFKNKNRFDIAADIVNKAEQVRQLPDVDMWSIIFSVIIWLCPFFNLSPLFISSCFFIAKCLFSAFVLEWAIYLGRHFYYMWVRPPVIMVQPMDDEELEPVQLEPLPYLQQKDFTYYYYRARYFLRDLMRLLIISGVFVVIGYYIVLDFIFLFK